MNHYNNFAVMSYSFHGLRNIGAMNLFGYLETVRYRYNLNTADIWNGFLESYEDAYLQLVREHIEERGLTVVNLCCDGAHLWDDDPTVRAECEKMAWDCIRAGRILGAKTIRIDVGSRSDEITPEQMDYVAAKYGEYCAAAAEFGARLGPENHWGGSTHYPSMEALFARVKAPNFGLLLHLGNWRGTEAEQDEYDR